MARYYILRDGERLYKDTVAAITAAAKRIANATGESVRVYEDRTGVGFGGAHTGTVRRGGGTHFTRNPAVTKTQREQLFEKSPEYDKGWDAGFNGVSSTENPYPKGSYGRSSWRLGHQMGAASKGAHLRHL